MRHGLLAIILLAAAPAGAQMTVLGGFSSAATSSTEGVSLGDVTGDGALEIVSVGWLGGLIGSTAEPARSQLAVRDSSGQLLWSVELTGYAATSPTLSDFDGDGLQEIAVCVAGVESHCEFYAGDGALVGATPSFTSEPGFQTTPSAGDLDSDGADDLVVATWDGEVLAFSGATQGLLWSFAHQGESFWGHSALGDVDGDGSVDVVLCGAATGRPYALSSVGVPMTGLVAAAVPSGKTCMATGPVLVEMNGEPGLEIVIAPSDGSETDLVGYTAAGVELFRSTIPGDTAFLSPVAGDVDADGEVEVFLATWSHVLWRRAGSGVLSSVVLPDETWVPPAFVDCEPDGVLEVLVSTKQDILLFDGQTLGSRGSVAAVDGVYPAPVHADLDGDGRLDIVVSSWWTHELRSFETDSVAILSWPSVQGTGLRQGSAAGGAGSLPADPADALVIVMNLLENLLISGSMPAKAENDVTNAVKDITKAIDHLLDSALDAAAGNPSKAAHDVDKAVHDIDKSIQDLEKASRDGADMSLAIAMLGAIRDSL